MDKTSTTDFLPTVLLAHRRNSKVSIETNDLEQDTMFCISRKKAVLTWK